MPDRTKILMTRKALYRITEKRDGAIFKTEFVMYIWLPMEPEPRAPLGYTLAVMNDPAELSMGTMYAI